MLSKKSLLVMLFCTMPFLAMEQPETRLDRAEIATKKPSRIKAGLRYVLDTVKSDLSIGNKVVQHESVSSQLAAAGRLCGYHLLITTPMFFLSPSSKLDSPQDHADDTLFALANSPIGTFALMALYGGVIGPIIEEALFTYVPKIIGDKLPLKVHNTILLAAAATFGNGHSQKSFSGLISSGCSNYVHGRYLLGRSSTNATPIYAHMMWNSLNVSLLLGVAACIKYKMNA